MFKERLVPAALLIIAVASLGIVLASQNSNLEDTQPTEQCLVENSEVIVKESEVVHVQSSPEVNYDKGEFLLDDLVCKTQASFGKYVDMGFSALNYLDSTGRSLLPVSSTNVSATGEVDITAVTPNGNTIILTLKNLKRKSRPAEDCPVVEVRITGESGDTSLCGLRVGDSLSSIPDWQIRPQSCGDGWRAYDVTDDGRLIVYVHYDGYTITEVHLCDYHIF